MNWNVGVKAILFGGSLIVLAGCVPPAERPDKAPLSSAPTASIGCAARATAPWIAGGQIYSVEAFSDGPDCTKAVAILVIRNAKGESLWIDTFNASQNLALSGAKTAAEMQPALAAWIAETDINGKALITTTADLPAWNTGQTMPVRGEFPFYTEDGVTREDYTKLRAQKLPMFCYVQGIESEACLALHDGALEKIGAQSFPR